MSESAEIMPLSTFVAYRRLALENRRLKHEKGYCEPWVPYVGPDFGAAGSPRIVYCGAAPAYNRNDEGSYPPDDEAALRMATKRWADFAAGGGYDSAFWRLGKLIVENLDGPPPSPNPFSRIAWTNLTKLNAVGDSAPKGGGAELLSLDVAQMTREISILRPDILICVSGSMLTSTGNRVFADCEPMLVQPETSNTLVKRLPSGGILYWTMHPNWKTKAWSQSVISDLLRLTGA
jgi:hypothetical protein